MTMTEGDSFEYAEFDGARRKDERARRGALNAADVAILCLPAGRCGAGGGLVN